MTSNGLALFVALSLVTLFVPTDRVVPPFVFLVVLTFTILLGRRALSVLRRAAMSVGSLVVLLAAVWVGIVGHAPERMLFFRPNGPVTAWTAVLATGSRLLTLSLLSFSATAAASRLRPDFVSGLAVPRSLKAVLLSTLSFADVLREGSRRAHTALVAANIVSPRMSLRNLRHGWLLLRTVWVAAVGIASERLDTKWLFEDLPHAAVQTDVTPVSLSRADLFWLSGALIALVLSVVDHWHRVLS
jgi:hypothetical protein